MEDRAKCFHLSASIGRSSSRKDILTDRKREIGQEKAIDFTVFKDAYSAVVSGEQINQKKKKAKEYCMLMFSDLSQRVLFCYLLVEFFNPSIEICVLEEL